MNAQNSIKISVLLTIIFFTALGAIGYIFSNKPLVIKSDILALLPLSEENDTKQKAFEHISSGTIGRINILFSSDKDHDNIDRLKEAGQYFESKLSRENFLSINYLVDSTEYKKMIGELANYNILSDRARKELLEKSYDNISLNALTMFYSAVDMSLAPVEKDPFFLMNDFMIELGLLKSGFSPYMGVLTADYEGKAYTFMSLNLDINVVFSPKKLQKVVEKIFEAKNETVESYPDLSINITGVPIHTYFASSGSIKEINIISIISFSIVLLISLIALRSIFAFIFAAISIGMGFGSAFMITVAYFGEIHTLTLVFGTSLIGISIDYFLHYFIEHACEKNSYLALKKIKGAITMSFVTSCMGFLTLLFSSMTILRQMALFSITGLAVAYLTIITFYPLIFSKINLSIPPNFMIKAEKNLTNLIKIIFTGKLPVKITVFAIILIIGIVQIKGKDDISYLYKPKEELLKEEILFAKVSKQDIALNMVVVKGRNNDELLQNEEELRIILDKEIEIGSLKAYKAISQLVPSKKRQMENAELITELIDSELPKSPLASIHEKIVKIQKDKTKNIFTLEELSSYKQLDMLKTFWINDNFTIVLLEGVKNLSSLEKNLDGKENFLFMNKVEDINNTLKEYRYKTSVVIAIVYLVILCFLMLRYGFRQGLLSIAPSTIAVLILLSIFGYLGVSISFFHTIALFLVLCFGMDYTIFQVETKGKLVLAGLAIMLSCITTLASFGLLALTSFEVTKALGITLFTGILLSYILSPMAKVFKQDK